MSIQCWVAKVECLVFTFTTPTTLNLVGTIWVQLGLLPRSCRKWQLECNRTERYKLGTMTYQRSYFKTEQTRFNERHDVGPNADTCAYPFLARKDWVCKIQYNSTLFLLLRTASLHNDHVLSLDGMHGSLWKRQRPSFTCPKLTPSELNLIWEGRARWCGLETNHDCESLYSPTLTTILSRVIYIIISCTKPSGSSLESGILVHHCRGYIVGQPGPFGVPFHKPTSVYPG